jgi:hypothetical protein
MAGLVFETSIVGVEKVKAALADLESRFARSNSNTSKANVDKKNLAFLDKINKEVDKRYKAEDRIIRAGEKARKAEEQHYVNKRREAERAHSENLRRISRETKEQERAAARTEKIRGTKVAKQAKAITGAVGDAISTTLRYSVIAATAAVGYAIKDVISQRSISANIANEMNMPGKRVNLGETQKGIEQKFAGISKETGMPFSQIAQGYRSAIGVTGEPDLFMGMMGDLAKITDFASGNIEDFGKAAGNIVAMLKASGMTDKNALHTNTIDILRQLTEQAKKGSINMDDFSRTLGVMTGSSTLFSGNAKRNLMETTALAQFAVESGGARGPDEAGTAAQRFAMDMVKHADRIKKDYGVNVIDEKTGQLAGSPAEMAELMIEVTKGDMSKLAKIFLAESIKAVIPLNREYLKAVSKGEDGRAAIKAKVAGFTKFNVTDEEVNKGAAFRSSQPDRQLAKQWEMFVSKSKDILIDKTDDKGNVIKKGGLTEVIELLPKLSEVLINSLKAFKILSSALGLVNSPLKLMATSLVLFTSKNLASGFLENLGARYYVNAANWNRGQLGRTINDSQPVGRGNGMPTLFGSAQLAAGSFMGQSAGGAFSASTAVGGAAGVAGSIFGVLAAAGIGVYIGKEIANTMFDYIESNKKQSLMDAIQGSVISTGKDLGEKKSALDVINGQISNVNDSKGNFADWTEWFAARLSNVPAMFSDFYKTDGKSSIDQQLEQLNAAKADLEASIKKQQADLDAAKASEQLTSNTAKASSSLSSLVEVVDKVKDRFGSLNDKPLGDKSRGGR